MKRYHQNRWIKYGRDLGIVNGTGLNLAARGGSGASFNAMALVENFGFSKNIKSLKNNRVIPGWRGGLVPDWTIG